MPDGSRREAGVPATGVVIVPVPAMLCRRCVRVVSRRVRDVPGVVSLEVDVELGLLRVRGNADRAALVTALESGGFGGCEVTAGGD